MVLPKSTVHLSRFAGTALKSFTHGYAQTVVAASQSSYASQNTPVAPLASNFLSRLNKSNKLQDQHAHYGTAAHSQTSAGGSSVKQDLAHPDSGLIQYYEAWHKLQKSDAKEWQQFQFAKRIGWHAPNAVSKSGTEQPEVVEVESDVKEPVRPLGGEAIKRSYSTSAINDFSQAIDNEVAEAVAFAQVNEAISEEVERSRQDAERAASVTRSVSQSDKASAELSRPESSPATSVSSLDAHTAQLDELLRAQQYAQIPTAFEAMLRAGVAQPTPLAYRALLASAIKLTANKHQQVPRVLEVYSDMLRRKVVPDAETYASLLNVLSSHALDSVVKQKQLLETRTRFALPGEPDSFIFRSDSLEHTLLAQDQSLSISLRIFNSAHSSTSMPPGIYETLILACAERGLLIDMMNLYGAMESKRLLPQAIIFPAMIEAFASVGDLRNAVECYNEYKALAIANDEGVNSIARMDEKVYAALIKAYGLCDRQTAAHRFLNQIQADQPTEAKRQMVLDTVTIDALIPVQMRAGNFEQVSAFANALSEPAFPVALELISKNAADQGNVVESTKAFNALVNTGADLSKPAAALLAVHVRSNTVEAAEPYWRALELSRPSLSFLEPTVMRAVALIQLGQIVRALRSARAMFGRIRASSVAVETRSEEIVDKIDESIELLMKRSASTAASLQPEASAELLRMMVENGSLLGYFAEDALASLSAEQILHLSPADLDIFTQLQARMILDESPRDVAGPARFAMLLETIVSRSILPDVTTENLVEKTLINLNRNDLSRLWNSYRYPTATGFTPAFAPPTPFLPTPPPQPMYEETMDPYAAHTDNKGSVAITDLLEKGHGRPLSILNEAMNKFRNIRRTGRHPRFFAYSKLISAAAKENQFETCKEVLEMAKQDVPFNPIYRVVRHGWFSIVDSMLAACLMLGRRDLAAKYHQDLLDLGSAPSANTYGLYITTLKENTGTSDEASEAVKIFLRSKAEGVEPTSFLYNALIGKLGKARRIDDCLFYFAEMRNLGVRPTSVTYGTIVNALCRVSDEKFAEEIFEEMESCSNYKPRPAPYHSLMQYFLTTKRDRSKVLAYFERMQSRGIEPTMHTYKLLIDAYATLSPIDMSAAEAVLDKMSKAGVQAEAVHYASLIHAKGCVLHELSGARDLFDTVVNDHKIRLQACVYQAMFESLVANRQIAEADALLLHMRAHHVELTPYIANALIHGWTQEKNVQKAREAFELVDFKHREPSTYESMVRAHMAVEDREGAQAVVAEALSRGYPAAVAGKIVELIGGGRA
ncbi:hypothetical protein MBLNU457_5019t1 [Dothideomycetes sp. NU457]